ncbi:hypothetical protein Terro_2696 [Terriglobus roseus DSM 18391]|uniref:Glycosyltransferase RgtA/B/C/D-like domain-containing protein n=1 Tax=Terriglobus roseus (strain DSM 18391 / NRRL B-41598 / KBS 63) TaxID=926566 RepID=I3ZI65_TERRK|nr:hypothetical protein [Terriglobus roseus]AFL88933.1 hypothetical protein Terro_2696 [Terriglobus roseus DSM 18391]
MPSQSALRKNLLAILTWVTYILGTLQVVRFYMASIPGIDLDAYLHGTAPLPFQKRYLPAIIIRYMLQIPPLVRFLLKHHIVLSPPARGCSLILSTIALGITGYLAVRLYRAVSPQGRMAAFVYPLLLLCTLLSYAVHVEQNTYLPYDLPSLAFFTGGLLCIYTRRFWPLVAVVLIGTLNRETTLFLICLFLIDAASVPEGEAITRWRDRFRLARVSWLRLLLLCVAWLVPELVLSRMFAGNDRSQNYLRVVENLHSLYPAAWPALLNICGYMLPFVLLLHPSIRPRRFGNYALVALPWFITMFAWGVLSETRIYGELVSLTTVAAILLIEQHMAHGAAGTAIVDAPKPAAVV